MQNVNTSYEIISIILAIVSFIIVLLLGGRSDMLRETDSTSPYSFSKFQLFLWTLVICPAFCLHWPFSTTGPTLNETALVLLGISSATTVAAAVIKSAQKTSTLRAGQVLKTGRPSEGFWKDILSDDNGNMSLVRVQNLAFTITYLAIYLSIFFPTRTALPVFDGTAYTLMGISSGGYLIGRSMYL